MLMKILILDVYANKIARISKDTFGGYGTVNDYGNGFIPKKLTKLKANSSGWPPLYSVYVAAVIRERGHSVQFEKKTINQLAFMCLEGVDVCLLTSSIVCHETELQAVKFLKHRQMPVGVMGPFAATIPQPYLKAGAFVIKGEPEFFLKNYDLEKLKTTEGILESEANTNINELPFPAWDIVLQNLKPRYSLLGRGETFLPIIATRGCPYSCYHYCAYPLQQGRRVRVRTPQKIVEEMIFWQQTQGVSLFMFRDPVFAINKRHTEQLCHELIDSRKQLKFIVETHLNNLDEGLSKLLKKAGLAMVKCGVESVEDNVLKSAKRFTIPEDQQMEKIRMLEKLGIKVTCFYMIAMPEDTEESVLNMINYAKTINSYGAQFSVFTPYPGTPIFGEYQHKIISDSYEGYTQYDLVFQHKNLTAEQTRNFLGKAYSKYYTNPAWVKKNLLGWFSS